MRHYGRLESYIGYGPPVMMEEGEIMTEQARYNRAGQGLIMGIDPGPTESAYAIVRPDYTLISAAKVSNQDMRERIADSEFSRTYVIESLACYGRPVGRETFETAYMVGAYREIAQRKGQCILYDRPTYANAIAGTNRVTDAMLYQALRLRFGPATKGGPLYGLRGNSDLRSAYALAVFHLDCLARPAQARKGSR